MRRGKVKHNLVPTDDSPPSQRSVGCSLSSSLCVLCVLCGPFINGCRDPEKPIAVWLTTGVGPSQVVYPRAIAYDKGRDQFVVVDRMARIQRIDRAGKYVADWHMPDSQLGKPVGISVGPDGNIWVPDTHYHRVIVYDPTGKEIRRFGKMGNGPGEFIYTTDIAFDNKGRVFVAEYGEHDRIQVFDINGNYQYEFGKFGQGDGEFSRPQSIVIVHDLLYIADACNHRIVVFTTDGKWVKNIGKVGTAAGEFRFPYGIDVSDGGQLIVTEFGNNRVQKIDPKTGQSLQLWGKAGRQPGELAYPWASAVNGRGEVVVVDAGNNRLQVFR